MMRRRMLHGAVLLAFLTVTFSCGGDGPTGDGKATPGTLKVMLTSPSTADAAMAVELSGEGIQDVAVSGIGRTAYVRQVAPQRFRILVFGPVGTSEMLSFAVPNTKQHARYSAKVLEVSDEQNALRASLSTYQLTVVP